MKLPNLFIPSKTAALVPEFEMEDSEEPALGQNTDNDAMSRQPQRSICMYI